MDKNLKTKVCSTCKRNLPLEMFRKRSCAPDGLMYQCKDCKNKIDKFYRQSDKGRQAAKKDRIRRKEYWVLKIRMKNKGEEMMLILDFVRD